MVTACRDTKPNAIRVKNNRLIAAGLLVSTATAAIPVFGEDSQAALPFPVSVSATIWQTRGDTKWDHNASALDPTIGNPSSRLEYQGMDSTVLELNARADLRGRWFVEAGVGAGAISNGTLVDDDFVSAAGAQFYGTSVPGEHLFSRTISEISDDNLFYLNLSVGRGVYRSAGDRVRLELFAQAQHWEERYIGSGVMQTVCTAPNLLCMPVGFSGFQGQPVITNKSQWQSLSIGANGRMRIGENLELNARLTFSPLTRLDNQDGHLLRTDLNPDPSFTMSGTGYGYGADIAAVYSFTPRLSAHAGFRYWKMKVSNETGGWAVHPAGGGEVAADLNNFETARKGIMLGMTYRFGGAPSAEPAQ